MSFVAALADQFDENEVLVVEASSFALDRVQHFRAQSAAWLNLSPDHLDWHGDFESYALAKAKIFHGQSSDDFAIVPNELGCSLRGFRSLKRNGSPLGCLLEMSTARSQCLALTARKLLISQIFRWRAHTIS